MLVGGGELHDRWSSLVGVSEPLGRGIQRFTGITQAMVDEAPPPGRVLPALAEQMKGRLLVAHNARFDVGVLKQAFERAELEWPDPPVMCTVALARRLAPLQRRRGLASLADALGIEVEQTHRALPDAETCARVLCALLPRLCANARTVGEALVAAAPAQGAEAQAGARHARARRAARPHPLPKDPGVYIFRDADGRPLYVGKSICLRTRARAHFTTPVDLDRPGRARRLPADRVRARRARAREPADQGAQAARQHAAQEGAPTATSTCAAGSTSRSRSSRSRASPPPATRSASARSAAAPPPPSWSSSSTRCSGCATAAARCTTRPHPSAYGQMGRCLSPCLGDLDPNLYRERLDEALGLFEVDGGAALLAHVEAQMREASAAQHYERAAWLRRRARRLESLLGRLGGVLRAAHAGSRLVLAPHPAEPGRADVFWIVAGRIADWGPLPATRTSSSARTTSRWPRAARAARRLAARGRARRAADRRRRGSPATRTRRCSSSATRTRRRASAGGAVDRGSAGQWGAGRAAGTWGVAERRPRWPAKRGTPPGGQPRS